MTDELDIACPSCKANVGRLCRRGGAMSLTPHKVRKDRAKADTDMEAIATEQTLEAREEALAPENRESRPWLGVTCPQCKSIGGEPCRNVLGVPIVAHQARIESLNRVEVAVQSAKVPWPVEACPDHLGFKCSDCSDIDPDVRAAATVMATRTGLPALSCIQVTVSMLNAADEARVKNRH